VQIVTLHFYNHNCSMMRLRSRHDDSYGEFFSSLACVKLVFYQDASRAHHLTIFEGKGREERYYLYHFMFNPIRSVCSPKIYSTLNSHYFYFILFSMR
jgi:hypothetical protein